MAGTIQIFGTKKCSDTRKAERWFKERRVAVSIIDLRERGLSPGELRAVAARVTLDALVDREGARYRDRGLAYAAPGPARLAELLVEDPLLLRTPVVRRGADATVGYRPEVWQTWLSA